MKRRLAAVMAADVVGFSRLMRADEAGTFERLKSLRCELVEPRVAEFNGRVFKLMGDGLLAEFTSLDSAIQCAVSIQKDVAQREPEISGNRRIQLRLGINVGDVMSEGSDIYGDVVNVAARLEAMAQPGGICISGKAYEEVRDRLTDKFEDLGEQELKNIDRPLQVWRWLPGDADSPAEDVPLSLPDKPSIAVLPFDNMSGDQEQDYFADGIVEDIITALSRIEWFFVTARNSSFTYKGRAVDVQQVGSELGVRYVLEGSVRRSGDRLRITAQLIDASSGKHVWAERYDRELSDIFDVQDEITRNVVASTQTQIQLTEGEHIRELERLSLPVWALVNRSWILMYELTDESLQEAIRLSEEAITLDPESGRAHQILAAALCHWVWMGFAPDADTAVVRGIKIAERAIRLDNNNEYSHWTLGLLKNISGDHDKAVAELEHAIEINPNCSLAYGTLGTVLNFAGDPDRSIVNNGIAIRSNPRDPSIFFRYSGLALSHFLIEQFEIATDWARKSIQLKYDWYQGHSVLIASLIELGHFEKADLALKEFKRARPHASLEEIKRLRFRIPEHAERLVSALRKAGLSN